MSIKNRVFTAAVAAMLLAGTASFAVSEPRQGRRAAVEEGQGFLGELFERVRELLGGRRSDVQNPRSEQPLQRKCGTFPDPNGLCK